MALQQPRLCLKNGSVWEMCHRVSTVLRKPVNIAVSRTSTPHLPKTRQLSSENQKLSHLFSRFVPQVNKN